MPPKKSEKQKDEIPATSSWRAESLEKNYSVGFKSEFRFVFETNLN